MTAFGFVSLATYAVVLALLGVGLFALSHVRARAVRIASLVVGSVVVITWAFIGLLWTPSIIARWYESGAWPLFPLRHREYRVAVDERLTINVRGREIRHVGDNADWLWELLLERETGATVPIGSAWSREDSLRIDVLVDDGLIGVTLYGQSTVFLGTAEGPFRSQRFAYPFLDSPEYWRTLVPSMRVGLADLERMHRDLADDEKRVNPRVTIEKYDLPARQVIVSYRWSATTRVATFALDTNSAELRLLSLSKRRT